MTLLIASRIVLRQFKKIKKNFFLKNKRLGSELMHFQTGDSVVSDEDIHDFIDDKTSFSSKLTNPQYFDYSESVLKFSKHMYFQSFYQIIFSSEEGYKWYYDFKANKGSFEGNLFRIEWIIPELNLPFTIELRGKKFKLRKKDKIIKKISQR